VKTHVLAGFVAEGCEMLTPQHSVAAESLSISGAACLRQKEKEGGANCLPLGVDQERE
jgi:hypothetical protein